MLCFPNAKINIGLNILSKRPDNYHNLQTVFYPVKIKDALEIIKTNENSDLEFKNSGIIINTPPEKNLIIKAYNILKKDFKLPKIKIHLHKKIPLGAGLGGGSANASEMLKLLNKFFELKLSDSQLVKYASQLGADCPFFIKNKPAFATQKGNKLELINLDLSNYKILIIKPKISINTAEIFKLVIPNQNVFNLKRITDLSITRWKSYIHNDFENIIFKKHKQIQKIKLSLYQNGAIYASMSGTGSAVFGIFNKKNNTANFKNILSNIAPGAICYNG